MPASEPGLRDAFIEEHRVLTRGFAALLDALRSNDLAEARRLAEELDHAAGPHIEFEETIFYPALESALGEDEVEMLYREHEIGLGVIRALLDRDPDVPLTEVEQTRLISAAQTMLDHTVSCGTLLSHVDALDAERRAGMLDALRSTQAGARRWSERPPRR